MVTEEDRGFVFTRKLPSTPALATTSVPATTKTSKARNGGSAQEPELARPTTPLPPSPERTPSREAYTHGPFTKTKPSKSQDHRSKPVASSTTTKTATVASMSRLRHQPQYTPERATDVITAIPMRETPMIKKNKDLRSGSRRSSFAMRGKRASTIGNGFSGKDDTPYLFLLLSFRAKLRVLSKEQRNTTSRTLIGFDFYFSWEI